MFLADAGWHGGCPWLFFLVPAAIAAFFLWRGRAWRSRGGPGPWGRPGGPKAPGDGGPEGVRTAAEDVLAQRYARGEISDEEYWERLSVLREGRR